MKIGKILSFLIAGVLLAGFGPRVETEHGRTFLLDQTRERWEITDALARGFRAELFQFGLGRDAFQPLDDSALKGVTEKNGGGDVRVIGIERGSEAQAYAVSRLRPHEIANSRIGGTPIAAAY